MKLNYPTFCWKWKMFSVLAFAGRHYRKTILDGFFARIKMWGLTNNFLSQFRYQFVCGWPCSWWQSGALLATEDPRCVRCLVERNTAPCSSARYTCSDGRTGGGGCCSSVVCCSTAVYHQLCCRSGISWQLHVDSCSWPRVACPGVTGPVPLVSYAWSPHTTASLTHQQMIN